MKKSIRSFTLSLVVMLILASCSLTSSSPQAQVALATQSLPTIVTIELTVQAEPATPFNAVGQVIQYKYNVKNTSTTSTLGPVTVPGATCPEVKTIGNGDVNFDANEMITCTSNYTITQADLDKGSLTNIVTATINGVSSNAVTTTIAAAQPTILKLTKTANPITYDQIGQTVTFTYVITNSGATTLGPAQFIVTDTGISAPINCGAATTTLAQNATVTCTATYTVTQSNLDAGLVATTATASGGGVPQSQPASATITKGTVVQSNANLTAGSTIKHQVVNGEWLWQIARCYGANPDKVVQANPQISNPARIAPDTTVTVPNIGSAGKIYGKPCVGTHTVQSGETWASIAQKYNADATVLQRVNSNTLTVGKVLIVPLNSLGSTPVITSTRTACPIPSGWVGITVQSNDTLNSIATRYGTTSQILTQKNCLTSTSISTGAVIYIPPPATAYPNP